MSTNSFFYLPGVDEARPYLRFARSYSRFKKDYDALKKEVKEYESDNYKDPLYNPLYDSYSSGKRKDEFRILYIYKHYLTMGELEFTEFYKGYGGTMDEKFKKRLPELNLKYLKI